MNKELLTWVIRTLSGILLSFSSWFIYKIDGKIEIISTKQNRVDIENTIQQKDIEKNTDRLKEHDKLFEELIKLYYGNRHKTSEQTGN